MMAKIPDHKLDKKSLDEIAKLLPAFKAVVFRASIITLIPFRITDGQRTKTEQAHYVKIGASKTMNSKHLIQPDGFAYAVDAVPFINGKPKWEWALVFQVAVAFDRAATDLGVAKNIVWGGVWDKRLSAYGGSPKLMEAESTAYNARHPGPDFKDGPHFEWRK